MGTRIPNSFEILKWLEHHWIWFAVAIAVIVMYVVTSILVEIYDAYIETKNRPKEAMEWCPVHGPVRKQHCLPLFPGMKKSNGEDFLVCPMCYKTNVFDNPDARLG